jgi:NAD(P)-dependent dehydrogenase (short-subunit alcohol dehydrogenase family)
LKHWVLLIIFVALTAQGQDQVMPDSKPTVLITGANRGIGFEFVRQFAARDWRIIATTRSPENAIALAELAADNPDIIIEQLDVTDHARIDALAEQYKQQPIDILLLNAALGPTRETATAQLPQLDWEVGRQSLEVNAIGPMKVTQAFMEHVKASQKKQIIAMSSDSGSFVAGSQLPILYHYKMSKAALNMYLHTLAFATRKRGVTVVMLHPGLVATNPDLARMPSAMPTDVSVSKMFEVIDALTPADNGRFISYEGADMPW